MWYWRRALTISQIDKIKKLKKKMNTQKPIWNMLRSRRKIQIENSIRNSPWLTTIIVE